MISTFKTVKLERDVMIREDDINGDGTDVIIGEIAGGKTGSSSRTGNEGRYLTRFTKTGNITQMLKPEDPSNPGMYLSEGQVWDDRLTYNYI